MSKWNKMSFLIVLGFDLFRPFVHVDHNCLFDLRSPAEQGWTVEMSCRDLSNLFSRFNYNFKNFIIFPSNKLFNFLLKLPFTNTWESIFTNQNRSLHHVIHVEWLMGKWSNWIEINRNLLVQHFWWSRNSCPITKSAFLCIFYTTRSSLCRNYDYQSKSEMMSHHSIRWIDIPTKRLTFILEVKIGSKTE